MHRRRALKYPLQNQFGDVRRLQSTNLLGDRQRMLADARGSKRTQLVSRKRQRRPQVTEGAEEGMAQRKESTSRRQLRVEIHEIFYVLNDAGGDAGSLQFIHQEPALEIAAPASRHPISRRSVRRLAQVCEAPQILPIGGSR